MVTDNQAHKILDPAYGPLIGVKLHIITRKTLGGIQTDLDGRALDPVGSPIGGLYAAGEAAAFGGGGAHGYNALEGTCLGGCIFTGRTVGRSLARLLSHPWAFCPDVLAGSTRLGGLTAFPSPADRAGRAMRVCPGSARRRVAGSPGRSRISSVNDAEEAGSSTFE